MITGKNIDEVLKKDYFEQIKAFFKKCSSKSERTKYVEEKYGISGWAVPERIEKIIESESQISLF